MNPNAFIPGSSQTKEETADWWYRHPITLPTMPEEPLNEVIIERKTVYLENLTDGQFLKLQAKVHDLEDKLRPITKKRSKYD